MKQNELQKIRNKNKQERAKLISILENNDFSDSELAKIEIDAKRNVKVSDFVSEQMKRFK